MILPDRIFEEIFPERIAEEEMELRMKEWQLAGYRVVMHPERNKLYIFDGRRRKCDYTLGLVEWKRRDPSWRDMMRMAKYGQSRGKIQKMLRPK